MLCKINLNKKEEKNPYKYISILYVMKLSTSCWSWTHNQYITIIMRNLLVTSG